MAHGRTNRCGVGAVAGFTAASISYFVVRAVSSHLEGRPKRCLFLRYTYIHDVIWQLDALGFYRSVTGSICVYLDILLVKDS